MSQTSRDIIAFFAFIYLGGLFLLTPISDAEVTWYEVREIKEEY